MRYRHALGVVAAVSLALGTLGCEGDRGPAGPPGPEGPEGPTGPPGEGVSDVTFQGNFGQPCLHCHATIVSNYLVTGHRFAFDDLGDRQGELYCQQCHTTGFDSDVAYGDTEIAPENRGPDVSGYDDYAGVDTEEALQRRTALEGVQCESCHGPLGPDFNAHEPTISFSTHFVGEESTSLCYPCHETQLEEWVESGHANSEGGDVQALSDHFGRSSCDYCHTSEGFIRENDPRYLTYEFGDQYTFIGCPTCHDPHVGEAGGGNFAQLRNLRAQEVLYTFPYSPGDDEVARMEGYGAAQMCVQCHHGRRDTNHVLNQIANGYAHFGPHRSPQMDMFIGAGSYEIPGYTYIRAFIHQWEIENACVACHMVRETELHGQTVEHPFHTWEPTVGNCEPCHGVIPDFNLDGVQTEILGKMDQLAQLFGYADFADLEEHWDSRAPDVQAWEREALYAAFFVLDDGSLGLHNPNYARDLLDNAIAYTESMLAP